MKNINRDFRLPQPANNGSLKAASFNEVKTNLARFGEAQTPSAPAPRQPENGVARFSGCRGAGADGVWASPKLAMFVLTSLKLAAF
ncbi:MAG: hypothetical protein ACFNNL_03290, partial [Kingella oralis]